MTKGTYCLIMKLDSPSDIRIGRRPPLRFPRGFYCYVGSALNSLEKRTGRHMSRNKRLHWHIDYFLEHARIVGIKSIESQNRLECMVSREVAGLADGVPMEGFGSSDCSCRSHLHYFRANPSGRIEGVMEKWKTS